MSQEDFQGQGENSLNFYSISQTICRGRNFVYRALDTKTKTNVVLKTFPIRAKIQEAYLREKAHLSALSHPNIIKLYEAVDMATSNVNSIEEEVSYLALEQASYGDMHEIISKNGYMSEILTRTIFRQLIDAISYLHSREIAHLDLKVENLLLDEDFNLKLIDFDLSQNLGSASVPSKGTPGYRPPELKSGSCNDFKAVDVYSAAVVLFIMVSGYPPYVEIPRGSRGSESDYDGYYKLLRNNISRFWDVHAKHKNNSEFYSKEFKSLVSSMLSEEPEKRPSLEKIIESEWYQGPTLSAEEYVNEMTDYFTSKTN